MRVIVNPSELTAGKWYACGFERTDEPGIIDWGGAAIYRYLGDGEWADDAREPVDHLWCPVLQVRVAMDAADAYMES